MVKTTQYQPPDEARRRNMAAIKSKNTTPEVAVRRLLHAAGFRFRLHQKDLPGSPDIVLPRYKTVVQVFGCYWHGHGCGNDHIAKTNTKYWAPKIARNKQRDAKNRSTLEHLGWHVIEVWECSIGKQSKELIDYLERRRAELTSQSFK